MIKVDQGVVMFIDFLSLQVNKYMKINKIHQLLITRIHMHGKNFQILEIKNRSTYDLDFDQDELKARLNMGQAMFERLTSYWRSNMFIHVGFINVHFNRF